MDFIRQRLNKLKSKVNSTFEEDIPHEGLKILESFCVSHHIFFSESLDFTENTSKKRIIISFIINLAIWLIKLKSLIMYFLNDRFLSPMFGGFSYPFNRPDIPELLLFILAAVFAYSGKYK